MINSGEQKSQPSGLNMLVMHTDAYTSITCKHIEILFQDTNLSILSTIVLLPRIHVWFSLQLLKDVANDTSPKSSTD